MSKPENCVRIREENGKLSVCVTHFFISTGQFSQGQWEFSGSFSKTFYWPTWWSHSATQKMLFTVDVQVGKHSALDNCES